MDSPATPTVSPNIEDLVSIHSHSTEINSRLSPILSQSYYLGSPTKLDTSPPQSLLNHSLSKDVHPDFQYNKHNESVFDDERLFPSLQNKANDDLVKFDENNPELINNATFKALLVQLTSPEIIDYNLICDFFLTYRVFISSEQVMNLLLTRLIWSLQYINSSAESNVRIGKLVLLRTFVVLRHWIINYFVDDFDSNPTLCDLFTTTINKITIESNLVSNKIGHDEKSNTKSMVFEKKILSDLKIHWLNLINEFWKLNLDIDDIIEQKNILTHELPLSSDFKTSKSNPELTSLHTNPSYRRSAMLSLYDKKALHKCIIFDGLNHEDENPQYSISNLLLQHQSSRQSLNLKLQELQQRDKKSPVINNFQFQTAARTKPSTAAEARSKTPLAPTNRHNHMNLKDSSLALKKTSSNSNHNSSDITPTETRPEVPEKDNVVPATPKKAWRLEDSGFSTNGNIKLPTSKVVSILPPTPVKKMEYILKTGPGDFNRSSFNGSPRKNNLQPPHIVDETDVGRKRSIKKFVDGWKKTIINSTTYRHHDSDKPLSAMVSNDPEDANEVNTLINNALNSLNEKNESIGHRVDVLSARIIDELEYLLRYYIRNESSPSAIIEDDRAISVEDQNDDLPSANIDEIDYDYDDRDDGFNFSQGVDVMGSPAKKPKISRGVMVSPMRSEFENVTDNSEEDGSDMDINDLSDLNIIKIDNLINVKGTSSKTQNRAHAIIAQPTSASNENLLSDSLVNNSQESSFQRPASINWNDEGNLDLEDSEVIAEEPEDVPDFFQDKGSGLVKSGTQYFDVSNELLNPNANFESYHHDQSNSSMESSMSTPSNITQYDAEIAELGIALSPQSMKQHVQVPIPSAGIIGPALPHSKRISFEQNIGAHRRASAISRNSRNSGGSALRRDSMKSYISYDSAFSISNGSNHEEQLNSGGLKKMNGFNNLRTMAGPSKSLSNNATSRTVSDLKSLDLPVKMQTASMTSFISRSSSVRRSIRFSTLCALTELPFSNYQTESIIEKKNSILQRSSKSSYVADSSIFSLALKSRKNSVKTATIEGTHSSNNSSANSVAIPGISSYVLKELAAIPDESFQSNDPVEFALYKLEGKDSSNLSSSRSKKTLTEEGPSPKTDPNSTEEILDEIRNAKTEDAIDFSMQQDITPEVPLTPVKRRINPVQPPPNTSTPNEESVFFNPSNLNSRSTSPGLKSPKIILENYVPSNEVLSVKKVMDTSSHISFILGFDSQSLANHFTIIEKDMLQEVDWKELIELKWNKELTPVNSWLEIIVNDYYYHKNKGVNLIIARFNLMVNWIISEIILTKSQRERICIISRFIHVAQKCFSLQNFSTLMQIILALTSEKVQKLRETWKNLPPGDILMLKNLEELASPLRNFLNIRLCINQMKPSKGCIPFVGLYLSDLIFNAERPTFIKPKKTKTMDPRVPGIGEISQRRVASPSSISTARFDYSDLTSSTINTVSEVEKVINFSKFRTSVHIVKSLSQCIEWSSHYTFKAQPELLSKCLYIKSLDEEEMNFCLSNMDDT